MSKLSKIAVAAALVSSATAASITTTLAQSDERVNLIELAVYVSDIGANLAQYYSFQALHKTETYPAEIAKAVFAGGDFTTMLTGISGDEVTRMVTGVPWYSTRIKAAISEALANEGIATVVSISSADASTTSAQPSATSESSSEATTSKSSEAASSTSDAASSTVATSSAESSAVESSAAETTAVSSSAAIPSTYSNSTSAASSASFSRTAVVNNGTQSTTTKTHASTVLTTITSCSAGVCSTLTSPVSSAATSASSATKVIDVSTNGAQKFGNGVFGAAAIAGAAALLL
ncbi:dan1p [Saccharomyces arboricola H-6]|uniref:Dan1p n=1 Tax=Saccharomyces arboricola (strain H-6 / AS 2.3317 / CBS 10644) TaxID=1160507 RepID=J8Q6A3_SACAR|nr:dan1p [Saccharomyces arboricola H-6]